MWSPGFESQAGPGQAAVDKVGPVLDFLQLVLDDADQALPVNNSGIATRQAPHPPHSSSPPGPVPAPAPAIRRGCRAHVVSAEPKSMNAASTPYVLVRVVSK